MGEKLVVGAPINKGLKTDRTAFVIDNDSFPTLVNAYQWRGRAKRRRGTVPISRLQRNIAVSTSLTSDNVNLISALSLGSTASIVPGSINLVGGTDGTTYTDPNKDGTLTATGGTGTGGSINYASGLLTITSGGTETITGTVQYYPGLPVMGLEDFFPNAMVQPGTVGFDTVYAYNIPTNYPYTAYDISFYKNVTPAPATYPDYVPKSTWTALKWNGQDYQQFWSTNYQGAMWIVNGITTPFTTTNIGMQFKHIVSVTVTSGGPPAKATIVITGHGLVVGDFVFINEVATTTGINFQTGYVITVTDANTIVVEFPTATISTDGTGGIAQYLTNNSDVTKDCIRWYDGDPTNANPPTPSGTLGWVNFMPPLSQKEYSVDETDELQYYLVGAVAILPFKDRLLFFGPVIQTSTGDPIYLQDTVIYSQNGTPYYTCTFTGSVTSPSSLLEILVPTHQTATPSSWFEDQTGFGGYQAAGVQYPILTVSPNEDALILGFPNQQVRLIYTGNDILPFNMFIVNSELGTSSTFSFINMDKGILSRGPRGFIIANQTGAQRIDLEIPDSVFEIALTNNGAQRICAARDFENEWVYFTYTGNNDTSDSPYPDQTLLYNYRDNSWGLFYESYTTYGQFRATTSDTGDIWENLNYFTWEEWNEPWSSGELTTSQPFVIGGNQVGFVLKVGFGTGEANSLFIKNVVVSGNLTTLTVPNHGLNQAVDGDGFNGTGDYFIVHGCLGTAEIMNGNIYSVNSVIDQNTITIEPSLPYSVTYLGGGLIQRMYVPQIMSKQFPVAWQMNRKTRLGPQSYLLSSTANGQVTLLIFLSQNYNDMAAGYNVGNIVPGTNVVNGSLIYSNTLYTCPELTNLGLTPANINLQQVTAKTQYAIWHRMNTSLIGDTVQIGITLSDAQMRAFSKDPLTVGEITGATNASPCVLTVVYPDSVNPILVGDVVQISGVEGMTEINYNPDSGNLYDVTAVSSTTITILVDATGFGTYTSGGTIARTSYDNQFAEIELHGFILDVNQSQLLC